MSTVHAQQQPSTPDTTTGTRLLATLRCARMLPAETWAWLGGLLGDAVSRWPGREQGRCRKHLAQAFPTRDAAWVERCTRRCFRHFGAMVGWSLGALHRSPAQLRRGVLIEGREHLRAAIASTRCGRPPVGLSAHIGNWELLARLIGSLAPVTLLGRRLRTAWADALIRALRAEGGQQLLYQDDGLGACVRALRAGRLLATLPDQDIRRLAGCFVPWFGHQAWTPIGPAAVAALARAPLWPCFLLRRGRRWVIVAGPLRELRHDLPRDQALVEVMAWFNAQHEALLRRYPWQWPWWHKRLRTRPEQDPKTTPRCDPDEGGPARNPQPKGLL